MTSDITFKCRPSKRRRRENRRKEGGSRRGTTRRRKGGGGKLMLTRESYPHRDAGQKRSRRHGQRPCSMGPRIENQYKKRGAKTFTGTQASVKPRIVPGNQGNVLTERDQNTVHCGKPPIESLRTVKLEESGG